MSEQSSPISLRPSAFYDPDSSCWRTSQLSLLSEAPELLPRLPAWGTTAGGALYEQATPEHLTAVRDGSASLNLPTPTANNAKESGTQRDWGGDLTAALLPTPLVDSEAEQSLDRYGPNLGMVLKDLVSTNPRFSGGAVNSDDDHPTLSMGTGDSRTTLSSG